MSIEDKRAYVKEYIDTVDSAELSTLFNRWTDIIIKNLLEDPDVYKDQDLTPLGIHYEVAEIEEVVRTKRKIITKIERGVQKP